MPLAHGKGRPRALSVTVRLNDRLRVGRVQRQQSRPERRPEEGAAAEESASVIRRPKISRRASARSTLSRRLHPVPVAAAIARRAMCMTWQARHEISRRTTLQPKASSAGVVDFGYFPRQCDFAQLIEDSGGANTSVISPI